MRKLRVALIGCGRISDSYRECFLALHGKIDVVFAVDILKERAETFAASFPNCQALTDYRDLFGKKVDVVHIALPHHLHAPVTIDCLKHGINVLTEKPMALTVQDCDAMIQAAEESHKLLGVISQTRYYNSVQLFKEKFDAGDFGAPLGVRSFLTWHRGPHYYEKSDWKGSWDKEGGGVLIDQGIHSLDRVLYLMGSEVDWVEASMANRIHPYIETEDVLEATIHFKNGVLYHLYATDSYSYDPAIEIEFHCEKGGFRLKQDTGYYHLNGEKEIKVVPIEHVKARKAYWGSTHILQLKEFYQAVREGTPILVTAEEGRKTLEVVKAIYRSASKKKRVYLPLMDDKLLTGVKLHD